MKKSNRELQKQKIINFCSRIHNIFYRKNSEAPKPVLSLGMRTEFVEADQNYDSRNQETLIETLNFNHFSLCNELSG